MKKRSRLIAMLVAVVMILSTACTCVFADEKSSKTELTDYVSFGDSVTRGVCCEGDSGESYGSDNPVYNYTVRAPKGAYPELVANALGIKIDSAPATTENEISDENRYHGMNSPGQTLDGTMMMLGIERAVTEPEPYLYNGFMYGDFYESYSGYHYNEETGLFEHTTKGRYEKEAEGFNGQGKACIEKAKLITIELGLIDCIVDPIYQLINGKATAEDLPELLCNYYSRWEANYPVFLDTLIEWNPDAKIMLVGNFNWLYNCTFDDTCVIPFANLGLYTEKMNSQLQKWADERGSNVEYVDIYNVDCTGTIDGWNIQTNIFDMKDEADFSQLMRIVHPTPAGYHYIARQILNEMNDEDDGDTDIVLDMGRHISQINHVILDGKLVRYPEFEEAEDGATIINISNRSKYRSSLIVSFITLDSETLKPTMEFYTYTLEYDRRQGYTCHRVYNTSDMVGTAGKVVNAAVTTVTTGKPPFINAIIRWFGI